MAGVQVVKTNTVGELQFNTLGTDAIPLISKNDWRMLQKLILAAHVTSVALGRQEGHRALTATIGQMRRGVFPSYTPNLGNLVSVVTLAFCRSCILRRGKTGMSPVPTYTKLAGVTSKVMDSISLDLVGPFPLKSAKETRGRPNIKGHFLVSSCLHTGYTKLLLLTGISTADVLLALLTLQQQFTAIRTILSDAGTQFALDITVYEPKNQVEKKLLVALQRSVKAGTRGQSSNYVERKILEIKKIWGAVYGNATTTLPALTFGEAQLLIAYTENLLNSIPYQDSDVRPKDLVGGEVVIPHELEVSIKEGNLKSLKESLAKVKIFRNSMKEEIQRLKLAGPSVWKKKPDKNSEIPLKVGDLVFIRGSKGSTGSERLGVVKSMSFTTAVVESVTPTGQKSKSKFKMNDLVLAVSAEGPEVKD